jgi:hypothetical protein
VPAFIQPEVDPSNRQYDVTIDGQEFVMILPPGESVADTGPPPQVQAVVGWFEKLKSKAATR